MLETIQSPTDLKQLSLGELEKLAAAYPDLVIGKVSVEDPGNVQLAASLGVDAIPALFFYRNGKLEKRLVGFMTSEELAAQLGL